RGDRLQDVQALGDRAERRVVRAERGVLVDQEELAAVGARPGVGHRHGPGLVGDRAGGPGRAEVVQVLVLELVPGAAGAGAGRVAALQHVDARGGQPVAVGVVEVVLPGPVLEREGRVRRLGGQRGEDDIAAVYGLAACTALNTGMPTSLDAVPLLV